MFDSVEELHKYRYLSKGKESRDVGLMADVKHFDFFVHDGFKFAAIDDEGSTCDISIFFAGTDVNSGYKI